MHFSKTPKRMENPFKEDEYELDVLEIFRFKIEK